MMNTNSTRETVSALADGHLEGDAFVAAVQQVCHDDDMRATWQAYHLVGDVLREGLHGGCSDQAQFLSRFQARLAAEAPMQPVVRTSAEVPSMLRTRMAAANEPVFRWKLVAGAASIAAAAAIGWNLMAPATFGTGSQLAQQQIPSTMASSASAVDARGGARQTLQVVSGGGAQAVIRDPRLDQLLEAHREAGGASQMPSGFLRNATFEGAGR